MRISIVIPTYNHCTDLLAPCLESVLKYTDLNDVEVIVVANGCTDGTRDYLKDKPVRLVWFDEGIGYTRATNEGAKVATGEFLVFLNNDTIIMDHPKNGWLSQLTDPFKDPKVGITGPMKMTCPHARRELLVFFCVCVRRSLFEQYGPLDEIFSPGYGEDTDFCCKLEDAGYTINQCVRESKSVVIDGLSVMVGDFPIYHKGHVTFRDVKDDGEIIRRNSRILEERYRVKIKRALQCSGWMSEAELRWLGREATKRKVIIEVGSWHGRSTRALGDNTDGVVYAVDHFNGSSSEVEQTIHASAKLERGDHAFMQFCRNNFDLIQRGKVVPLRGSSESMAKVLREQGVKADMIFIDAGHTYEEVRADIAYWQDLLADDGILCGHDVNAWAGVNQAVQEAMQVFYVAENTTIWFGGKGDVRVQSAIYDCFIFNDELDILETRLHELFDVVDRFVIVEATRTHSNKPKPLHFRENLERFSKYLGKVTHIVVDDYPATDPWGIERHQRNCIMRGLTGCRDTDVVIISDCDEIPDPDAIRGYHRVEGIRSFSMDFYYYDIYTKSLEKWTEAKILPYGLLRQVTPCGARYTQCPTIPYGGRHLSYFGGVDKIVKKLEDFAHQEYNTDQYKDRDRIRAAVEQGTDLFNRAGQRFVRMWDTKHKVDLRDTTFLLLVQVDHPDRRENFRVCLRMIQRYFDTHVSVLEVRSPIGLSVRDLCDGVDYEAHESEGPLLHMTRWQNHMIDASRTPIVIPMDVDIVITPGQIRESVQAIRDGATYSIPFQPKWGGFFLNRKFRDDFGKDLDFRLLGDSSCRYMEEAGYFIRLTSEGIGGLFVADKRTFRGMCGGLNEDMHGWCPNDLERLERVEKLGYVSHWVRGFMYHLEHWRGPNSGSLDSPGNKSDNFVQSENLLLQLRGLSRTQLEQWLATRPWFQAGRATL